MKNQKGFFITSKKCENALIHKIEIAKILQSELKQKNINPNSTNLEWHHNGRYISFFIEYDYTKKDLELVENLKKLLDSKTCLFKSKAEAMRYIESLPNCSENDTLSLRIKKGKYGNFVTFNKAFSSNKDTFKQVPNMDIYQAIFNLFC